jgi:hypothetical protein
LSSEQKNDGLPEPKRRQKFSNPGRMSLRIREKAGTNRSANMVRERSTVRPQATLAREVTPEITRTKEVTGADWE